MVALAANWKSNEAQNRKEPSLVWGYRGRLGGNINIVIMAGNDKKIRVMSRVKAPKWAPISPYYRDVKELRDEMDERRIQWRMLGGMEDRRKYIMDKIWKLGGILAYHEYSIRL